MQLTLTEDTQDMILSVERIDVDYRRVSPETSIKIAGFVMKTLPQLSPRALTVIVRDIETERERYQNMGKEHPTMKNWNQVEEQAVALLDVMYNITTHKRGLYTDFDYPDNNLPPYKTGKIEITNSQYSRLMRGAFDYALGRLSYMVEATTSYIHDNARYLAEEDKKYIVKRIRDYEEEHKKANSDDQAFYHMEGACINSWVNLAQYLEK